MKKFKVKEDPKKEIIQKKMHLNQSQSQDQNQIIEIKLRKKIIF